MFSKKSIVSSFFIVLFLGFFVTKAVAEEDDDDILGEIVTDLLIGVGIAICEEFVICKFFMIMVTFICIIILIISLCSGEITCGDICNGRNARRGLTAGAGYSLARSFRRR
tara:strand:- start:399 stop:731 length:333 start_codon:yes stop_codon:yes gene_type:complete